MKVGIVGDVHLEFAQLDLKNPGDVDVLILAGDICVSSQLGVNDPSMMNTKSERFHNFFQQVSSEFKDIIYITGNHESYHFDFKQTIPNLRKHLSYLKNIHILDNQTYHFGDICFICGTLWTDMQKENPLVMESIKYMMNDFRIIKNSNRMIRSDEWMDELNLVPDNFTPQDAVAEHKKMVSFIDTVYRNSPPSVKKFVVVGHHAPSTLSIHPKYKNNPEMNAGYSSDLSNFILDHPKITHWFHSHIHHPQDYMIGETRIVANPRGYVGIEHDLVENWELQVIEI